MVDRDRVTLLLCVGLTVCVVLRVSVDLAVITLADTLTERVTVGLLD